MDETYIKVKKVWMYLYRAVDSEGNTLEFLLSGTRDAEAAKRFFVKALHSTAWARETSRIRSPSLPACLEWPPKLNRKVSLHVHGIPPRVLQHNRKWNQIEHRLFAFISINWRAKPLTPLEVVLELISHTTTKEGLAVTALKDSNTYPTALKVSDAELATLNISRDPFHGEWNYTIKPQEK